MPLTIIREDITKMKVDVIVNAANNALQMGGGVCGAIFRAAGAKELQEACDIIGYCATGEAAITSGFKLLARYIIHTPGPIWGGGDQGEANLLRDAYLNSLELAREHHCESIAFPLISTGIYGYPYPKMEALRIATAAIGDFLNDHDMEVYLVVFDKASFSTSKQLIEEVQEFVDERYVEEHSPMYRRRLPQADAHLLEPPPAAPSKRQKYEQPVAGPAELGASSSMAANLGKIIGNLDESFSQTLLRLIDARGLTDAEVYKRANIDRKLFSKIRSNPAYMPSKKTAVAFAVALELSVPETEDLLERAGYALSRSQKFDVIIEYFLTNRNYNIFEINEALFYFDQQLLGV